ncbi:hypothetical protein [Nostoc sp.]|uniref:hypothetical protein n=1 Tax=Nostoc sp. TaxID=1180 RepID=UPI002FF9DBB9
MGSGEEAFSGCTEFFQKSNRSPIAGLVITYPVDYFATYNIKHFLNIEGLTAMTPEHILSLLSY